ncbi:hypothetical protein BKA61DRAFT_619778 [Leptodontidium sp. MPI-SDFR-AT-0119]|nr:hypothetical protein BKA61DRAFT_619778 [Leptodontidium sp. MPI-SDFR-AT-0119]
MEIQTLEFTEEELLIMHRYFITSLYLEERKTEVEIVSLLWENYRLEVTVSQVTKCIRDWRLELPTLSELQPEEPLTPLDEGWVMVPSMRSSPVPTHMPYTPSDPNIMSLYSKRPLPSLPTSKPSPKMDTKSRVRKRKHPNTDKLRATCHHGAGPSNSHEVETTLSSMPDGPSQMELYVGDYQNHERIPLGLEIDKSQFSYARAGRGKDGAARRHHLAKVSRRPTHTSSREKRYKDKEDEKGKERQRTGSPSSTETRGRETSNES